MIPRYGRPPRPAIHYRRRPGAYAILLRAGQILLTHQQWPQPDYQLPGGGIEPGEHPLAALHREVFEETGWRLSDPVLVGAYRRFCWLPDYEYHAEKRCSVWLARPSLRLGAPTEPGHSAVWVTVGQALRLLGDPGSRALLRRVVARS